MIYTLEDGDNQYNNVNVFMSSFGANTGDSNAITMCRDTILSYSMYSPMFIKTWLQHLSKKNFNWKCCHNQISSKFLFNYWHNLLKLYTSNIFGTWDVHTIFNKIVIPNWRVKYVLETICFEMDCCPRAERFSYTIS